MRVAILLVFVFLLGGGVAHAADPKCLTRLESWSYDREKEALQAAGERFLDEVQACDPSLSAAILYSVAARQLIQAHCLSPALAVGEMSAM